MHGRVAALTDSCQSRAWRELENAEVRALQRQGPARVKARICKGLLRNRYGPRVDIAFPEVRAARKAEVA